jgi:hypothetical protein
MSGITIALSAAFASHKSLMTISTSGIRRTTSPLNISTTRCPPSFCAKKYCADASAAAGWLIIEACASFTPCREVDSTGVISVLGRPLDIASEHNLVKLWDRLVSIVTANRRKPMLDDSQALRRIIAQFNEIDPSSMLTRYGLKKNLEAFSMDKIRKLSLQNLRDLMTKLMEDLGEVLVRFQYVDEPWWDEDLHNEWRAEQARSTSD